MCKNLFKQFFFFGIIFCIFANNLFAANLTKSECHDIAELGIKSLMYGYSLGTSIRCKMMSQFLTFEFGPYLSHQESKRFTKYLIELMTND